ncbi:hypothetical protein QM298_10705 [Pseudomonas mendocina]|nr:hypothetical protein [Pseudomonas mendocina]MDV5861378.1 hypothetical protein [Pseudomonas mendocina]
MNHQRLEGRQHAIDCIKAVLGAPRAMFDDRGPLITVLDNLEATAKKQPAQYAMGVMDVCREVRA